MLPATATSCSRHASCASRGPHAPHDAAYHSLRSASRSLCCPAAWGHTVASIGRVELAARLLLEQGVVGCLAAAVSRFSSGASDGGPAQAAASLGALQACCVALGALASSGRAVRVAVTRGRGLEALQVAMSLNATVDRAMRSAFPSLEPWLAGREKHGLRRVKLVQFA